MNRPIGWHEVVGADVKELEAEALKAEQIYDHLLYLDHPDSRRHKRMPPENRAAQFLPFAALTGYGDAVAETARQTDHKEELDENRKAELDQTLQLISQLGVSCPPVTITYFLADKKKEGGTYVAYSGQIKKIDPIKKILIMGDKTMIPIDDISDLTLVPED